MDTNTLSITYKKKEKLSKEGKYFRVIVGLTYIAFAIFSLLKGFHNYLVTVFIILGIIQFALVLWGKELSNTRHVLEVTDKKLTITTSRFESVDIDFKSVKKISILSSGFKISFEDSFKFLSTPWLTIDQAQILKDKLVLIAGQNNFDIN
jgi:hypothetical protein